MNYRIRINGERRVRRLRVKTGIYRDAVAAVPAIFGLDLPVDVEIWVPSLLPEYGPYHYRVRQNEFVGLVVEYLVRRP
jgi:hypothetical protein